MLVPDPVRAPGQQYARVETIDTLESASTVGEDTTIAEWLRGALGKCRERMPA
jgi:hypothetical protein